MIPLRIALVSATLAQGRAPSPTFVEDILRAGIARAIAVALAGFTLGFVVWYGLLVPHLDPILSNVALLASVVAGPALALVLWRSYAAYFARRTGVTFARALQYDTYTWLPFLAIWLTFVLSPAIAREARLVAIATALFCAIKIAIAARFNQTVREVLLDFLASRAAILIIAELAAVIIGQRAGQHVQESSDALLAVWGRWDAVHYLDIATQGYAGTDMAFFPLFPALIALVGGVLGNHLIAGLLISNGCFFFGLLYLYKLIEHEFDRTVARRAIFYVSIFPSAIFFSAVYTESLFFFLTVASFYYMRERKWLLAGIFGGLAAASRVEGVLLVVPYALEWFASHKRLDRSAIVSALQSALIPAGLFIYMAYLWVLNGDPLYFSHVQAHWNRHFAPPWVSFINAFAKIAHTVSAQTVANQLLEISFTVLMLAVLAFGWNRLRPSYIAYMGLSILVPMSTSSLMSMPRFALVLFPMFAILALWGKRPWVNNLIVALFLPMLGLFTVLFADWYWVA